MRVVIMGASGLLGHAMFRLWSKRADWHVIGTYHGMPLSGMLPLDIREIEKVKALLKRERPDIVALPASNPWVDYCETHARETRLLNVDATLAVAEAAREAGARFLFISSDYVFDGARGSYTEEDEPAPLCEYGRQKLAVERALAAFADRVLVLRVSALFGWELRPRNFVLKALARLSAGQGMKAAVDQDYNPTYSEDLADAAAGLLELGAGGLLHACGSQRLTRLDLARLIAEVFDLDPALIVGVPLREFAAVQAAPRPLHTSLDSTKAARLLGRPFWSARQSLEHMKRTRKDWEARIAQAFPGGLKA